MTTVLVVDDQELVRTGFRLILERAGMNVLGEAIDGLDAVVQAQELRPDVVLMDLRMPRLDGIDATRRIMTRPGNTARVLALTTFDLDEYVYAAVRAGACGFLLKDVSPADLVHSVQAVARGDSMLAPVITRRLLERFVDQPPEGSIGKAAADLSGREQQVIKMVARGMTNAEIAGTIFLSESTVKTYVSRLLTKLDLRDRVQLAILAYETGLVRAGQTETGNASTS